ncbi:MAG TPA: hypothetical protein VHO91_00400, partial [Rhodopila sp.]|nr:hypothetical protein [Rhodopila sp.]
SYQPSETIEPGASPLKPRICYTSGMNIKGRDGSAGCLPGQLDDLRVPETATGLNSLLSCRHNIS